MNTVREKIIRIILIFSGISCLIPVTAFGIDARQIIKSALDQWRGTSSYSVMSMTIHRPDWERAMTMAAWTRGEKESLVRVLAPKKDKNNSTLLIDKVMWSYSPKINRIIKIPSSMMSQSWMGSDFSNKDIARSDDIIDQYTHKLIGQKKHGKHTAYIIESVPLENAPVVWGKEVLTVRDDWILLNHAFYDQEMKLVKQMKTLEVGEMGGRTIALKQRMQKVDKKDEWTQISVKSAKFDIDIPKRTFTLSNLRNPRQ